jgi:peptidoglycan/xylan/chitin deacetylase (PgdA/CDA1 family)
VLLVAVGSSVMVTAGKLALSSNVSAVQPQITEEPGAETVLTPIVLPGPASGMLQAQAGSSGLMGAVNVPILMYHKIPADFEAQLTALKARGYETVSLDAVTQALHGAALPAKPVVITFDDGFADQLQAIEPLKKYGMKATFYIINASERSQWCIGAGRRRGDPLQPAGGCGDSYLTWEQVRELDRSGVAEIGAHTMDHANLPSLSLEEARWEIAESKAGLERELGHTVRQFAYPYGAFTAQTAQLVREAGFETAVTTMPGTQQTPGHEFELLRVRDAYAVP